MTKRRLINQLPEYNQTDTLKKFFGATVDQLFQPGSSERIGGYIGQVPTYSDPLSDFYLAEPTIERTAYSLEPSMVDYETNGSLSHVLNYPDLIKYFQGIGANVSNQQRMFETNSFSWCPPINVDMLVNYGSYYWFGNNNADLPVLNLIAPTNSFTVGSTPSNTYPLPDSLPNTFENLQIYVNFVPVLFTVSGNNVVLNVMPSAGDYVIVTRLDDLTLSINTKQIFDVTGLLQQQTVSGDRTPTASGLFVPNVQYLSTGMRVRIFDAKRTIGLLTGQWDGLFIDYSTNPPTNHPLGWDTTPWDIYTEESGNIFFVDGVGSSISLVHDKTSSAEANPQYVTINRASHDLNPWSLRNGWAHEASFAWSQQTYPDRQAVRPIIEFNKDIVLYNWGTSQRELEPVQATLTGSATDGVNLIQVPDIVGRRIGTVFVDNNVTLVNGMRFLVRQTNSVTPSWNNKIYLVGNSGENYTLTLDGLQPTAEDNVPLSDDAVHATGSAIAYNLLFDGIQWKVTQVWSDQIEPLFKLFDVNGVSLDDVTKYPGSNFVGSRIFGFVHGAGVEDTILRHALSFDANGYIQFENNIVTHRYNFNGGSITGLYCAGFSSDAINITTQSNWYPLSANSQQGLNSSGLYQLPASLYANPSSLEIGKTTSPNSISKSVWSGQFNTILSGQSGPYRDSSRDNSLGRSILQHKAPLLKTMLLASNATYDFPQAVRYAEQEYTRFRNRFSRKLIELSNSGVILDVDENGVAVPPYVWVNLALNALIIDKNDTFPFALSDMAGGNFFIPPTPAALGVLPLSIPRMAIDYSYGNAIVSIVGHDGSFTAGSGDFRDYALLALETQIYNTINTKRLALNDLINPGVNDISIAETRLSFDIANWINGKFRNLADAYSNEEFTNLLGPFFEKWAQLLQIDFRTNTTYDPQNPFTWNYRDMTDLDGLSLPGSWRAIYRLYYDTVRPHTSPWEMLGFTDQPSWWVGKYGSAPYLVTNTALWADLEAGYIDQGPRAGIDARFTRPGLSRFIPVDAQGNLLDPVAARIVNQAPIPSMASRDWDLGDIGPVENLWVNSPSYRFAVTQSVFLMKPSRLIEECWDSYGIATLNGQWINLVTNERPINANLIIHGEVKQDGNIAVVSGVQQWIVDHMISTGLNSKQLGDDIRGLDVKLVHKMAGFITNDLKAVTDNFGIIPAEDVEIALYQSPGSNTEVYSGVIVEWTGTSWKVLGYDARDAYFNVIPPDTSSPKGLISLATAPEPIIHPWYPTTYYPSGIIVSYLGSIYKSVKNHTSAQKFEIAYWTATPGLDTKMAPRVVTYLNGLPDVVAVPYGAEFYTYQEVGDFLLGWERYLVSRGWIFDQQDPTTTTIRDWKMSVREFLAWAQMKWNAGNFIALSPGAEGLKFNAPVGTILDVENSSTGFFGLLDRSGQPVNRRSVQVARLDSEITLQVVNADIFGARLRVSEIEHALVFNNVTIFNDIIYQPEFDLRQARIRLIGLKAGNWVGRLDAPGYVLNGSAMLPNFEQTAEDVRMMFDIEMSNRQDLRDHARHVVGFQERNYLNSLLLADTEQFEFYQGMIEQKGAPGVFDKLLRNTRVSQNGNIQFLEEWAIRESIFGPPNDPRVTFSLFQNDVRRDPQLIKMTPSNITLDDWIVLGNTDSRWLDPVSNPSNFFTTLPKGAAPKVQDAGYVRVGGTTYSAFDSGALSTIYNLSTDAPLEGIVGNASFQAKNTIWLYDSPITHTWSVLSVFETSVDGSVNTISKIQTHAEDTSITNMRVFFTNPHGLTTNNIGAFVVIDALTSTQPDAQGIRTITNVNVSGNWIEINVTGSLGHDFASSPLVNVRLFQNMRFQNRTALHNTVLPFREGDIAYIDQDPVYWTVLKHTGGSWNIVRSQPSMVDPSKIVEGMIYDVGSRIVNKQMLLNEPLVNRLTIIDPIRGYFPGTAIDEISYILDYDPSEYNQGYSDISNDVWGETQVGQLWWNTKKSRYIMPYTDSLGNGDARDVAELAYRASHWASVAPNTSVDIYEWVMSDISPSDWTRRGDTTGPYQGTILNSDDPSWVQKQSYDPAFGNVTRYFFWVLKRNSTPNVSFRKIDAATVALLLENPSSLDIPWIAPISTDTLIISGVAQLLNNTSSTLKIEVTSGTEEEVHDEWMLLRPTDENSLPPDWLWRKLRDGLAQFNDNLSVTPYPTLHPLRQVGILDQQNIFSIPNVDGPRGGLMAARRSFVQAINNQFSALPIVVQNTTYVSTLNRETFLSQYLIWSRTDRSYIIELPPSVEWDVKVYSPMQMNALLQTPQFLNAVSTNKTIRILIDGTNDLTPQWSIWKFNNMNAESLIAANSNLSPAQALMTAAPSSCFDLALAYDFEDVSVDARNLRLSAETSPTGLAIQVGQRVLVRAAVSGFWVIYRYDPTNALAINNGFVIHRVQTYKTSDFYNFVDWYAPGYKANKPPRVTYSTTALRDAIEGDNPKNLFVKILNGWNGDSWIWTVYNSVTLGWDVVAYQSGTVALSVKFFDPTADVHGLTPLTPSTATIANRDGSWELRALADTLRFGGILSNAHINDLFFSMLHFIHSQQDEVTWAFKTSFMVINGYNVPLSATPYSIASQTDSLLSYVNEVKPYHVKVRDFTNQYSLANDTANAHTMDFDKPPYTDVGGNRILDLTVSADQAILATAPWSDWNANPSAPQVRHFNMTMTYDRTTIDSSVGISSILPNLFEGLTIDGGTFSGTLPTDLSTDPSVGSEVVGYAQSSYYTQSLHPQELSAVSSDDAVRMKIVSPNWIGGAPSQTVNTFDVSSNTNATATLILSGPVAQSIDGLFVFRDGIRAYPATDFTFDFLGKSIVVNLVQNSARVQKVSVHSFGVGGASVIAEQQFFGFSGNQSFTMIGTYSANQIAVVVNGVRTSSFTVSGKIVTLTNSLTNGDDVAITVYSGTNSDACNVNTQVLPYQSNQTWTLQFPNPSAVPAEEGFIVDVNGQRIIPAVDFTVSNSSITISKTLASTDHITVTTFTNPTTLGIRTDTYTPRADGLYYVGGWDSSDGWDVDPWDSLPFGSTLSAFTHLQSNSYTFVSLNGIYLIPDVDYTFVPVPNDGIFCLSFQKTPTPTGTIVVTRFYGNVTREPIAWALSTNAMASLRNETSFDKLRLAYGNSGLLATNLLKSDTTVSIDVSHGSYSPKLLPQYPFAVPSPNNPGVAWIIGERIEYSTLSRTNDIITLGGLIRGTDGTSVAGYPAGTVIENGNDNFSSDVPVGSQYNGPLESPQGIRTSSVMTAPPSTSQWLALPLPTITPVTNLLPTADHLELGLISGGAGQATQVQMYSIGGNAWGNVLNIPANSLGGNFNLGNITPTRNGKKLLVNVSATPGIPNVANLDTTSGAQVNLYPYNTGSLSTSLSTGGSANVWMPTGQLFYMGANNPDFAIQMYTGAGSTAGEILPAIVWNISNASISGILFYTLISPTTSTVNQLGSDTAATIGALRSPGGKFWFEQSSSPDSLIGDPSIFPSNLFSGAPTTSIIFNNGLGAGSPVTVSNVPYRMVSSYTSNGSLVYASMTPFQTNLLSATLASNGSTGPSSYGSAAVDSASTQDYLATFQPFNLTNSTLGTPITAPTPAGFYTGYSVTSYAAGAGVGSAATIYIQSQTAFYKLIVP